MSIFACNGCGSSEHREFPTWITEPMKVVSCCQCGLIATFPGLDKSSIDEFYLESFDGDPGSANADHERLEQTEITKARLELNQHTIPIIERWVLPKGKDWLEVRFRTGAFLEYLVENGANAFGADLFDSNIQRARALLADQKLIKTTVHGLLNEFERPMDVISGVSIHVLSHLPNPTESLQTIRSILKDDGLIIIEEKDVTKISTEAKTLPLSHPNPIAHYHHFTLTTCRNLIEQSGFEILYAEYISRISDLHHFLIIARKSDAIRARIKLSKDQIESDFDTLINSHAVSKLN
jgi:2-polyprenyl-3-methyl-5-hydroxy-6-metoxy-1,4-benzoquinol methylase